MKKSSTTETNPEVAPVIETTAENTVDTSEFMTKADFENERFFTSNPNLVEHKEAIEGLVAKWYSLDDAKTVTLNNDETINNRANASNSNFTDWASGGGIQTYSQEDLYKLGQKDPWLKRQAMDMIAAGKAIETL